MEPFGEMDRPSGRGQFSSSPKEVGVHVLSEYVFCPRAAVLARESGKDDGEVEHPLGPRLDGFADYDERRFVEELHAAWGELRFWLTLLAPATLLMLLAWRLVSGYAGVVAQPAAVAFRRESGCALMRIWQLVRERAIFAAAVPATIDLASPEIREVNWWSLRKAGFRLPEAQRGLPLPRSTIGGLAVADAHEDRILRIPVVRKHRGKRQCRPQQVVRIAAYCRLMRRTKGQNLPSVS